MDEKNFVELREQAISLRNKGLSYSEIKKEIGISKSTLSYWLKNIQLKASHRKRLYTKQIEILSLGTQSQKERRKREVEQIIKQASAEIKFPLDPDAIRLMGAALYWAEGEKGGGFGICNSDPHVIVFMTKWLKEVFGTPANSLKAWLNIYPQQNDSELKKFWSELTDIPLKNFGKSYVKPLSSGYKKNNLYYGTIRIRAPKSTNMKHRIFGWIKATLVDIGPEIEFVQRRWQKLVELPRPINL